MPDSLVFGLYLPWYLREKEFSRRLDYRRVFAQSDTRLFAQICSRPTVHSSLREKRWCRVECRLSWNNNLGNLHGRHLFFYTLLLFLQHTHKFRSPEEASVDFFSFLFYLAVLLVRTQRSCSMRLKAINLKRGQSQFQASHLFAPNLGQLIFSSGLFLNFSCFAISSLSFCKNFLFSLSFSVLFFFL